MKTKTKKLIFSAVIIIMITAVLSFCFYVRSFLSPAKAKSLSESQSVELNEVKSSYSHPVLNYCSYEKIYNSALSLNCKSCIILDYETGTVVFEKNADMAIPPASLTKLVNMYILFEEIQANNISFNDIVPLPEESWYVNAPPGSSLMYLEQGQKVTLKELMLGMAVMSGNDAATAAAVYVSGSIPSFVKRMNDVVNYLHCNYTSFQDASGYSEYNTTTARDFARFTQIYLRQFPESIKLFHSIKEMTFNGITHTSTNKVLGVVEGVDGLKTGYINESGYNLALTACRDNKRIIAVLMGGSGLNSYEGNQNRIHDAKEITDWYYSTFTTKLPDYYSFDVSAFSGKHNFLTLVPLFVIPFTIPIEKQDSIRVEKEYNRIIDTPVKCGDKLGSLCFYYDDIVLGTVPLIADRTIEKGNFIKCLLDRIAKKICIKILNQKK